MPRKHARPAARKQREKLKEKIEKRQSSSSANRSYESPFGGVRSRILGDDRLFAALAGDMLIGGLAMAMTGKSGRRR